MKKSILLATTALVAGGLAFDASAVDVEVYGQVNKLVMHADNGTDSVTEIVDNDASSTRLGVRGSQRLDNGMEASVLLEAQIESNSSTDVTAISDDNGSTDDTFAERHSRVGLAGDFGAIYLGHTSTATDGAAEVDLGGVSDQMYNDLAVIGGSLELVNNAGTQIGSKDVGSVFSNYDGGRTNVVRYDSPIFNGFQVRASSTSGGDLEGSLRYKGRMGAVQVAAAAGYTAVNAGGSTLDNRMVFSASAQHDNGFGATVAYSQGEHTAAAREDGESMYAKVSYKMGDTSVAMDYIAAEHVSVNDEEVDAIGVGVQQNLGHGVSVSAMYRNISFGGTTQLDTAEDIDLVTAGLRVKF